MPQGRRQWVWASWATKAAGSARYQDRLLYGTDMNPEAEMYRVTFRLLETADEHFYPAYFRKYHWPLHAFATPDEILKKIYRDNALKLFSARER